MNLAIATAFFIVCAVAFRACASILQIYRGRRDLQDAGSWLHVFAGFTMSLIDPWNGSLFINEVMVTKRLDRSDYDLAVSELIADIMLVLLEDLPQLIIQIIYGVFSGQLERTTVAWFLSIFSTSIHLASQLHEIVYLAWQLPKLKKIHASQIEMD